jgi:hypothetical protein
MIVLAPDQSLQDEKATAQFVETMTREYGTSSRTFKSALIFCVPESSDNPALAIDTAAKGSASEAG